MPSKGKAPAKKAPAKKVDTPPPPPPTVPVVDVEPSTTETVGQELNAQFNEFMAKLTQMRTSLSKLATDFRSLQKRSERELKAAQKQGQKRKRKSGNRAPSGFVKPTLISDDLAAFLGKAKGSELARTDVTREINAYIRANNLQDPTNGRKINPDAKLTKLLSLKKSDELTYFNLQRFMSPHFQKAGGPPVTQSAPSSSK